MKIAQFHPSVRLNFRKCKRDVLAALLSIENANKYCNSSVKATLSPGLKIDTVKCCLPDLTGVMPKKTLNSF